MRLLPFLILSQALGAYAFWQADTATLQIPRIIVVNKSGGEKSIYQFEAGRPVAFSIRGRCSVRWVFNADSAGVIRVFRTLGNRDSALLEQPVAPGMNDIRLFCEPDVYRIVSTAPGRAQFFRWQAPNTLSIVPEGGGFPVPLLAKDSAAAPYYLATRDNPAVLKLAGPATAFIYIRTFAPVAGKSVPLDVEIREGRAIIAQRIIAPAPSGEVAFVKPMIGFVPGKPSLVKIQVPAGLHLYAVKPLNDRAMVKFVGKPRIPRPANPVPAMVQAPAPHAPTLDTAAEISAMASTGAFYNDNVYAYGAPNLAEFGTDPEKAYRYPHVNSLGDLSLPLNLRITYRKGPLRARGAVGAEKYLRNGQLDNLDFSAAVGWKGPERAPGIERVPEPGIAADTGAGSPADAARYPPTGALQGRLSVELGYGFFPARSVRPAYSRFLDRYSLMAFDHHRGDFRIRLENDWNPEMRLSIGMYDYVPGFDDLDAYFMEGALGIGRGLTLGITDAIDWNLSLGYGNIMAVKAEDYNWSNVYFSLAAGIDYDFKNWTFGLRGEVQPRFFTAGSDFDFHKGRKDLESGLTPSVQYHFRNLTVTGRILEVTGRRTWAVRSADEQAKSYLTLGGGINVFSSLAPLDWLRAGKG